MYCIRGDVTDVHTTTALLGSLTFLGSLSVRLLGPIMRHDAACLRLFAIGTGSSGLGFSIGNTKNKRAAADHIIIVDVVVDVIVMILFVGLCTSTYLPT